MSDEALGERFRSLNGAYDQGCMAYDHVQAGLDVLFPARTQEPDRLAAFGVEQLRERFRDLALEQYQAELHSEIARCNRLYSMVRAVEEELKRRPGDQRTALMPLYTHPNAQVRLVAAIATLAVAPEAARKALQELAGSKDYPQSGEAGGRLRSLDSGVFKPT